MPTWTAQALSPSHTIVIETPESGGRVIADNVLPEFAPLMAAAPGMARSLRNLLGQLNATPVSPELQAALAEAAASLPQAQVPA